VNKRFAYLLVALGIVAIGWLLVGIGGWQAWLPPAEAPPARPAELADPGRSVGERTAAEGVREEAEPTPSPSAGAVSFLAVDSTELPEKLAWRFTRSTAEGTESTQGKVLSLAGREALRVPTGVWEVECSSDSAWKPVEPTLDVAPEAETVCWVYREASLSIRVLDEADRPVAGATVRSRIAAHTAYRFLAPKFWLRPRVRLGVTNEEGRLSLTWPHVPVAELLVTCEGYEAAEARILAASEQDIVIHLFRGTAGRELRCLLRREERPAVGVSAHSLSGPIEGTSSDQGVLALPAWITDTSVLSLEGPSTCPSTYSLKHGFEVRLAERADVSVTFQGAPPGERVYLVPEMVRPLEGLDSTPALPPLVTVETGTTVLALPAGASISLRAFSLSGLSGFRVIDPVPGPQDATIAMGMDEQGTLELACTTAPMQPAVARARYGPRDLVSFPTDDQGTIRIPGVQAVERITVQAPRHVDTILVPSAGEGDRFGRLAVRLQPECSASIRVQDDAGSPVCGLEVLLDDLRVQSANRAMPELHGKWPTTHAGWLERPLPHRTGVTSRQGEVCIRGLAAGDYQLRFRIAPARIISRGQRDLYYPFTMSATFPSQEQVVAVVGRPVRARFEVRNGATGGPVRSVVVSAPDGRSGNPVEIPGSVWQGWVNRDSRVLRVASSGFRPEEIAIGAADSLEARIVLWPSEGTRLILEGDEARLESGKVHVVVQAPGEDWVIWDATVPCEKGVAFVSIPTGAPQHVTLTWTAAGGERVPLSPPRALWNRQAEMRFRLDP
jgi:hypothetical protein